MKAITNRWGRVVVMAVLALCWIGTTQTSSAAEDTPTRKLGRGISNMLFCVLEVPKSWEDIKEEHGEIAGITWGTVRGLGRTAMRFGVGVYEVVTFPHTQGPIVYPEFVLPKNEGEEDWRLRQKGDIY